MIFEVGGAHLDPPMGLPGCTILKKASFYARVCNCVLGAEKNRSFEYAQHMFWLEISL